MIPPMTPDGRWRHARRAADAGAMLLGAALPSSLAASNAALGLCTLALLAVAADESTRAAALSRLKACVRAPLFLALTAYAAASLVASLNGLEPARSLSLWHKDLHKLWVFVLLAALFDQRRRGLFAGSLAAGAVFAAVAGVLQSLGAAATILTAENHGVVDLAWPHVRSRGFLHPVVYGECLGLCFLSLLFAGERVMPARARSAALALLGVALALNQTRAVLGALLCAVALAAWLEPRWRRALYASVAGGALLVGLWELLPMGRSLIELLRRGLADPQAARATLWRVAWQVFLDHPWTGVGPGHYGTVFPSYFSGVLDGQRVWSSAHNLFLHQAAERGLAGLAALGAVVAALAAAVRRRARAGVDHWGLWGASAASAFLVMNLTETAFQTEQVATLFLAVWLATQVESDAKFL